MKKLATGLIFLCSAGSAFAGSGFSAELVLGQSDLELSGNGGSVDLGSATTFGLKGLYKFNSNFGLEFGYQDFGEAEKDLDLGFTSVRTKVSGSAINFGAKGIIPFDNGASLHAVLGLSMFDGDFNGTSDDGSDLYYGFGANYAFNEQFYMGADYHLYSYGTDADVDFDLSTLTISLGLKF